MKKYSQGWVVVGWAALALSAMVAVIIAIYGSGEEAARVTIRATARTSFALFLAAFTATALVKLWPGGLTRWLRANRRYVGVSFGVSHGLHAAGILALAYVTSGASVRETDAAALVGGSLAYLFIAAMVATSFDRTAAMLGHRKWQILHTTGMYILWAVFIFSYGGRAVSSVYYAPLALLLIAAIALRFVASMKRKQLVAAKGA
ncbi:MAG TPA: hypothetical protein VKA70_09480 [Blastocatellia bacterium]|nr:hypothetical protein [Blastocatellia bacterium]